MQDADPALMRKELDDPYSPEIGQFDIGGLVIYFCNEEQMTLIVYPKHWNCIFH